MSTARSAEYSAGLVQELCNFTGEVEWVEFKRNKADPQEIGEYISALANAAALNGKVHAYMLWGVDNETHDIVGTDFNPVPPGRATRRWRAGCCGCWNRRSVFALMG